MIFQDPLSALNPVHRIGDQIVEMIQSHQDMSEGGGARDARSSCSTSSASRSPTQRAQQYPHEFSGGMRQRVMIAMAIANDPEVLIADEPTTALDVTVQAQILEVMQRSSARCSTAIVLITHDLGVVARVADRVQVMYAGRAAERATSHRSVRPADRTRTRRVCCVASRRTGGDRLIADPGCAAEHAAPAVGLRVPRRAARTPIDAVRRRAARAAPVRRPARRRASAPTSCARGDRVTVMP